MKKILSQIAVFCFITGCAVATEEECKDNEHINEGVCEKDTLEQCGSPDNNCTKQKGWKKGVCAEGECIASDCKAGYEIKKGKCTATQPDLECADNEHVYEKECEKDTLEHCGSHDNNCSDIEGWASGVCKRGECLVTKCADRLVLKDGKCIEESAPECGNTEHLYGSECEEDSLIHCGNHETNCTLIEGWKNGICQNRTCFITECLDGYIIEGGKCVFTSTPTIPDLECGDGTHLYENECEEDTLDNCGNHGIQCANIDGWQTGTCTNGKCVVTSCKENYNQNGDTCVPVVPLKCSNIQHIFDGQCEDDSVENCGVHGTDCKNMTGWLTGKCENKMCVPTQCNSGFCIDQTTHICVNGASNTSACGINGGACMTCSTGQLCTTGQCVTPPPECTSTQHIYNNNCEDDSADHCGSHNNKCEIAGASGVKCDHKQCQITGCKAGYYSKNNACLPNDNNNCGTYGKVCNKDSVTNSETAACNTSTGSCYAKTCISTHHVYQGTCEQDSVDNCGEHDKACKVDDFPYSLKVGCKAKQCKIITCKPGLELTSDNKCVGQNGCPPMTPYDCSNGCCQHATCSGNCILAF